MAKIADAHFEGRTGRYNFEVYPIDTVFNPVGAVYIFSKRRMDAVSGKGLHEFVYVGETSSLADRIPSHEKFAAALYHGANCICVHRDENEVSRLAKETDLRAASLTPCNDQ